MFTVLYRYLVSASECDNLANKPQAPENYDIAERLFVADRVDFHPRGSRCNYDMLELFTKSSEAVETLWLHYNNEAYVMNAAGKTIATYRGRMTAEEEVKGPK